MNNKRTGPDDLGKRFTCCVGSREDALTEVELSASALDGLAPHLATCLRSCLSRTKKKEWITVRSYSAFWETGSGTSCTSKKLSFAFYGRFDRPL